jgi:hypothetical protein
MVCLGEKNNDWSWRCEENVPVLIDDRQQQGDWCFVCLIILESRDQWEKNAQPEQVRKWARSFNKLLDVYLHIFTPPQILHQFGKLKELKSKESPGLNLLGQKILEIR